MMLIYINFVLLFLAILDRILLLFIWNMDLFSEWMSFIMHLITLVLIKIGWNTITFNECKSIDPPHTIMKYVLWEKKFKFKIYLKMCQNKCHHG